MFFGIAITSKCRAKYAGLVRLHREQYIQVFGSQYLVKVRETSIKSKKNMDMKTWSTANRTCMDIVGPEGSGPLAQFSFESDRNSTLSCKFLAELIMRSRNKRASASTNPNLNPNHPPGAPLSESRADSVGGGWGRSAVCRVQHWR